MILETSQLGSNLIVVMPRVDQLDAGSATAFRDATEGLDQGRRYVVFDLSCVHFVDSSGLSELLALQRRLYARNVLLGVCGLTRTVQALFELMQVHRLIQVFPSREAAVSHYANLGVE